MKSVKQSRKRQQQKVKKPCTLHIISKPRHIPIQYCWIINHEFEAVRNDNLVDIDGEFEVNIWYSTEENTKTDVLREKVAYHKDIKVKSIVTEYMKNSDDVLARILKHPTVTNAKIIDDEIKLDIDMEIMAEIIGETKMQVTVFIPVVSDEEDIDDLDIEVNEDFLTDK